MAESIIEKCTSQVSNRFKLVLLASQRTHDLNTGASTPIQAVKFNNHKNTIISLYEIAEKQIDIHELFNLLVHRCKGYMKGNISNINKLEKLLHSSDRQLNTNFYTNQKNINIHNNEIKSKIDN
ncbi:MAG: DNA-directed RNA polymerase subunit omega [Wolbachia pipientis]|nr:DNA-directed RNA polymerase subunit omega [Wolbachia pipientis]